MKTVNPWTMRHSWQDIKVAFAALNPPYIGRSCRPAKISNSRRRRIYAQQRGTCYYCDRPLAPLGKQSKLSANDVPQLDHKVPVSRGGDGADDNLCYACRVCNQHKSCRTADEWLKYPRDAVSDLGVF